MDWDVRVRLLLCLELVGMFIISCLDTFVDSHANLLLLDAQTNVVRHNAWLGPGINLLVVGLLGPGHNVAAVGLRVVDRLLKGLDDDVRCQSGVLRLAVDFLLQLEVNAPGIVKGSVGTCGPRVSSAQCAGRCWVADYLRSCTALCSLA